jgi:hypothetical protein
MLFMVVVCVLRAITRHSSRIVSVIKINLYINLNIIFLFY